MWEQHALLVGKPSHDSSLGGHNRCRNPRMRNGQSRDRPWCWTRAEGNSKDAGWGYCKVGDPAEDTMLGGSCNRWQQPATALEIALEKAWRASVALVAALSSSGVLLVGLVAFCIVGCMFRRQRQTYRELESEFARARARHLTDTISSLDRVSTTKQDDERL